MPTQTTHPGDRIGRLCRFFLGVFTLALFLFVCSCATHKEIQSLSLSGADSGSTIQAVIGQDIDIKLQTIGPGQYETPAISSSSVQFLSSEFVLPAIPAGPTQLYRFRAVRCGRATIVIPHSVQTTGYSITINVDGS